MRCQESKIGTRYQTNLLFLLIHFSTFPLRCTIATNNMASGQHAVQPWTQTFGARSLGTLTSSWRPFCPLDFALCALRPCYLKIWKSECILNQIKRKCQKHICVICRINFSSKKSLRTEIDFFSAEILFSLTFQRSEVWFWGFKDKVSHIKVIYFSQSFPKFFSDRFYQCMQVKLLCIFVT